MQSPFFNRINPLGICETALWAVKCLRTFIKRKTADCGISESRRFYKERKWVTLIFWHRSGGFRPGGGRPRASGSWRRDHTLRRAAFFNLFEISITTRLLFLDLSTIYCLFCRTAITKTDFVMKNLSKVGFCKNRKRRYCLPRLWPDAEIRDVHKRQCGGKPRAAPRHSARIHV